MHLLCKRIFIALLLCSAGACGGGSSGGSASQPPPVSNANPGGIWFGTIFNASVGQSWQATGITLSTGESRFIDELGSQLTATINVSGNSFTGSLVAVAHVGSTFNDGSVRATGSITGLITERSRLSGTYQLSTGETGTLDLFYDSTYERSSSLQKVTGTWIDSESDTYTVDSTGAISGQDQFGCVYGGGISVIDASRNAYRVRLEVANCSGLSGTYTGLGTLGDWQAPNDSRLFVFQVSNQDWSLTSSIVKL